MDAKSLWFTFPNIPNANKWRLIYHHVQDLLRKSDFIFANDEGLTQSEILQWRQWRQSLRNLKTTYPNPDDVLIPEPPYSLQGE